MNKPIVNEHKTINVQLVIDGDNVIVETPWAVSVMPTEKVINMVMAYGSLHWKASSADKTATVEDAAERS